MSNYFEHLFVFDPCTEGFLRLSPIAQQQIVGFLERVFARSDVLTVNYAAASKR